jgi:hypothetical protein
MALIFEYWWMLLVSLGAVAAVIATLYFIFRRRYNNVNSKKYVANTGRLTQTKEYQKAYKRYHAGLLASIALLGIAGVSLIAITTKPILVQETEPIRYNRDIVLCLDVSGSMFNTDKEIISKFQELTDEFAGERISLVVFNSIANQVFPLTDDYNYMNQHLEDVGQSIDNLMDTEPENDGKPYDLSAYTIRGDGASLVGDGLTACLQSFDTNNETEKRSRSVILATDNIINGEQILTLGEAVDIGIRDEVKIYGINPEGADNATEADAMRQEVERSGGKYYPLSSPSLVPSIVDRISAEQTNATKGETIISKTDVPELPIILTGLAALGMMVIGWRLKV